MTHMQRITTTTTTTTNKPIFIKLDHIEDKPFFEFREADLKDKDFESEEFQEFKQSIKKQGLLLPITVKLSKQGGRYTIVDGYRRVQALKQLKKTEVQANVLRDEKEIDMILTTINQNIHRLNISKGARTKAIIKAFKRAGYTLDEVVQYSSSFRNKSSGAIKKIPIEFTKIFESLGITGYTLYFYATVYRSLREDVFNKANEVGLPLMHQYLLLKGQLSKYPERQLDLIDLIKDKKLDRARTYVDVLIQDIKEYEKLEKDEGENAAERLAEYQDENYNGGRVKGYGSERFKEVVSDTTDKIFQGTPELETEKKSNPKLEPIQNLLRILETADDFLESITGSEMEIKGWQDVVDRTKYYRQKIIDNIKEDGCLGLQKRLIYTIQTSREMLKMIEAKYPSDLSGYE